MAHSTLQHVFYVPCIPSICEKSLIRKPLAGQDLCCLLRLCEFYDVDHLKKILSFVCHIRLPPGKGNFKGFFNVSGPSQGLRAGFLKARVIIRNRSTDFCQQSRVNFQFGKSEDIQALFNSCSTCFACTKSSCLQSNWLLIGGTG